MKITRRQLREIISEAIQLPQPEPGKLDLSDYDDGSMDQEEFLYDTHAGRGPAQVKLTKSQRYDYSHEGVKKYMQKKGIQPISDNDARSLTRDMPNPDNTPFTYRVKDLLAPAFLLVTEDDEFMRHVQKRLPDRQGREILTVMGNDDTNVVFKRLESSRAYFVAMDGYIPRTEKYM